MTEEAVAARKVRADLTAARLYLEDARRVFRAAQLNSWTVGALSRDFGEIERAAASVRVRRWEQLVAKLEDTARFLGAE